MGRKRGETGCDSKSKSSSSASSRRRLLLLVVAIGTWAGAINEVLDMVETYDSWLDGKPQSSESDWSGGRSVSSGTGI